LTAVQRRRFLGESLEAILIKKKLYFAQL
jgi:hypothetical protein